jgi:uncharacterized protein YyaL (SSP411 family)
MKAPAGRNRLKAETSPYLLQHADNPVDWYPWGEEAFAKAKAEGKPLLVSIGYSSCHWCHVMEHESFENEKIAQLMNELFVCVKVDREERPDVDEIYMTSLQLMGLGGGWPLNAFATPEGKPFFGGTYYPPERRGNYPGWSDVLQHVARVWNEKRETIVAQSDTVVAALKSTSTFSPTAEIPEERLLTASADRLSHAFDEIHGGFGGAPKFPPHQTARARDGGEDSAEDGARRHLRSARRRLPSLRGR